MAFQQPPLPDFNPKITPMPDPLQKAMEVATIRQMVSGESARQQLLPLQLQEQQQLVQKQQMENEMTRIQLEGQKSMQKWLQEGDTNEDIPPEKFALNDKIATLIGVDPKDPIMQVIRSQAQHGVPAPILITNAQGMLQRRTEYNKGTVEQQNIIKGNYDVWKDGIANIYNQDPKHWALAVAEAIPRLAQSTHLSPELDSMLDMLRKSPEQAVPIAYNLVGAHAAALGLTKGEAEATKAVTEATEAARRARGEVTPEMATQQRMDIQKGVSIELAKEAALAPDLKQIASMTRSGRPYINRDDIPKGSEGLIEKRAAASGLPVVNNETAGTLQDIDEAKANMQSMLTIVQKKLAKGPGERIYKGPENKLEAAMQTDPDLAAMGTFRNAAIKTMRAVAGSKGLRINQYEVQMAIDNDIPKMTDTFEVAQAKINQLTTFLDNAEAAHLTRNRTAMKPAGAGANNFFTQFGGTQH